MECYLYVCILYHICIYKIYAIHTCTSLPKWQNLPCVIPSLKKLPINFQQKLFTFWIFVFTAVVNNHSGCFRLFDLPCLQHRKDTIINIDRQPYTAKKKIRVLQNRSGVDCRLFSTQKLHHQPIHGGGDGNEHVDRVVQTQLASPKDPIVDLLRSNTHKPSTTSFHRGLGNDVCGNQYELQRQKRQPKQRQRRRQRRRQGSLPNPLLGLD